MIIKIQHIKICWMQLNKCLEKKVRLLMFILEEDLVNHIPWDKFGV